MKFRTTQVGERWDEERTGASDQSVHFLNDQAMDVISPMLLYPVVCSIAIATHREWK